MAGVLPEDTHCRKLIRTILPPGTTDSAASNSTEQPSNDGVGVSTGSSAKYIRTGRCGRSSSQNGVAALVFGAMTLSIFRTEPVAYAEGEATSKASRRTPRSECPVAKRAANQCRPDQSSASRMELLGLEGSYFTLAVCPAATRSRCNCSSRPEMSWAVS